MTDEQLIIESSTQPRQGVTGGGLGQVQSFGGATDVSFGPKRLEHHQQVEVETRQVQGLHPVVAFWLIVRSHDSVSALQLTGIGRGVLE
jgi:hypothetical protein